MSNNALDRLFNIEGQNKNNKKYTVEEQLNSIDDSEEEFFLDGMTDDPKQALLNRVKPTKIELDDLKEDSLIAEDSIDIDIERPPERPMRPEDLPTEEEMADDVNEEIITVSKEPKKRGRKPKVKQEEKEDKKPVANQNPFDSILDVLGNDLLEELLKTKYTFHNFSHKDMELIINYMKDKLGG